MKRMLKFFAILLCLFFFMLVIVWFAGPWLLSFSVADSSGSISVPSLERPIEITFDAKGIPQIWAETDEDAMFALGWLHASERLFQMELIRRMAVGELAELFGEFAYDMDVFQRRLGIKRMAQQGVRKLTPETRELLEQYSQGINAWIAHKRILPPEFILINTTPEPWTPLDSLAIMLYQTWYVTEGMDANKDFHVLITRFGENLSQTLHTPLPWTHSIVEHPPRSLSFRRSRFPFRMTTASNSWVVSPRKSTTGAALHASDPHIEIWQVPVLWYIVGLHSREGLQFVGITAPGLPFGAMGHNGTIAYGFTLAGVDLVDYYRYQRHPDDTLKILTEHGYTPLTKRQEQIIVSGEEVQRTVEVYETDRGVVMEQTPEEVIVLKWAAFDFDIGESFSSAFSIMSAQDFPEFQEAVSGVGAFNVNWTYSDIHGNIGYQLGTSVPKRQYVNTFQYQDGADPATAWKGYYQPDELPSVLNPAKGWLASCNNTIVPEDWPYPLPQVYDPFRILRITDLFTEKETYSPHDMREMQMDVVSGIALQWKSLFASAAEYLGQQELARRILAWNGEMRVDEPLAYVFFSWWNDLPRVLFEDNLGDEWRHGEAIPEFVLTYHMQDIIDDQRTADHIETLDEIAANTLKSVLPRAEGKTLRDVSQYTIEHPLSEFPVLDSWLDLNRGPFYLPGDGGTLRVNWLWRDEKSGQFYTTIGPSMRYVMDWADVDDFCIYLNMGQSGNPFSPHYDDFLEIWLNGGDWNVPFHKEKVYARKASLLRLIP